MNKYIFLFVYTKMHTGGIQTLIIRISNWLITHGHHVKILLFYPGELLNLLNDKVDVKILEDDYELYIFPLKSRKLIKDKFFQNIDVIYSFDAVTCFFSSIIYRNLNPKPIFLTGVYNIKEYFRHGVFSYYTYFYSRLFGNYINDESKIFMNNIVRDSHEKFLNRKMPKSFIWPLATDNSFFLNLNRKPVKFEIVSVGRFVNFKMYNFYMIDVVANLIQEGYDVKYKMYGYGPREDDVRAAIVDKKMQDHISIEGKLRYQDLSKALENTYVFIGMGSSVIESGFCRVPSIVAIAYETEPISYGYLYQMPGYACGEKIDGMSSQKVYDLIIHLFEMSENEYNEEMDRTYNYVQKYSIDLLMNDFLKHIGDLSPDARHGNFPYAFYYIFIIYRFFFIPLKRFIRLLKLLKSRLIP